MQVKSDARLVLTNHPHPADEKQKSASATMSREALDTSDHVCRANIQRSGLVRSSRPEPTKNASPKGRKRRHRP